MIATGSHRGGRRPAAHTALLTTALLTGVLAGCTGTQPTAAPTLPPAPPTTISPTTTAATPSPTAITAGPPPHTPFTRHGAEQFVRAYYATANRAYQSGVTTDLRRYTRVTCACDGIADLIDHFARNHQRVEGTVFAILSIEAHPPLGNTDYVRATIRIIRRPLVDSEGHVIDHSDAKARQVDQFVLSYRNHVWHVARIISGG